MLVMSRREGQEVVIPQVEVRLRILELRGGSVRIGVSAPPHCAILKKEVMDLQESLQEMADAFGSQAPGSLTTAEIHRFRELLNFVQLSIYHITQLLKETSASNKVDDLLKQAGTGVQDLAALLRKSGPDEDKAAQPPEEADEQLDPAVRKKHVLLVEDQPNERRLMAHILERGGLRVDTAASASDALFFIRDERPDIFLLDIELPDMRGDELAAQIRQLPEFSETPIIAVTGLEMQGDEAEQQFSQWVRKPIDPEAFSGMIRSAVQRNPETA